ncbi:hypothetical protein ILUMI_00709 [Ignelater luminosus]|uniref:Ion transport domain-containing protein n=1 Tax=Ignelater luminosus TaxID=2038154 RepID=A0A8K0DLC4_IGNLU|nr:hypothetical protein ILUMI_00709 [Ignelater luminosus]
MIAQLLIYPTDSICQPPEIQLLDYVKTNQPVYKIQSFIIDNPEALTKIVGHPYDKPILYIACNELANTVTPEIVETLIKSGANLYYSDELHNYKEALHFAALGGNPQILQVIIRRLKLGKINSLSSGNTALNLLIKEGDPENSDFNECVRQLIRADTDVNQSDNKNLTPIFWAAKKGYRDVVQIILHESKQEVDIESHKLRGKSAKDYIIENGFEDILESLPSKSGNNNDGINPSSELFNFLKEYNEDGFINCKYLADFVDSDDGMYTLLQSATKKGLATAVENLLNNGADPNRTTAKVKMPPIEIAAIEGYHEILALLLKHKKIDIPSDILMETLRNIDSEITHESVNHNLCYSLLMEHRDKLNVNTLDNYKNTALHFAARYGGPERTLELLRAGASMACRNKYGTLPIEDIDANTLETHLDECLEVNIENNINKENFIATYNYRTIMPPRRIKNEDKVNKNAHDAEAANKLIAEEMQQLASETQVISYISKSAELRHLLKHPVVTSFLYIKWHRIRWFFFTNLAFYIAFCLSLILYILVVYGGNQNNNEYQNVNSILLGLLCVTFTLLLLRELFQIAVAPKIYFYSLENLLELTLIILTGIIIFHRSPTEALRKQVSAFAILLAAFELVILIGQHPKMSTNIVMLRTVSLNFFKFLLWYSILILAFSLSFYTLFKDTDVEDPKNSTSSEGDEQQFFIDPGISLFKTIVMLTGEFDASDIHFQVYPVTSHIIFMLFVFMIAIILFNLLNGLAVSDTQLIMSNSELVGHIARIEHIAYIESMLLGRILPSSSMKIIQKCCCFPSNIGYRSITPGILVKRVCLFPYFLKDYRMMVYPNQQAKVILTNAEYSDGDSETCIAQFTSIYLDKHTNKRTKRLIKMKKEALEQKKKEQNIIEMQELLRKEQQIIMNKLDYIITNMSVKV